jgi:cell division protease FtsH
MSDLPPPPPPPPPGRGRGQQNDDSKRDRRNDFSSGDDAGDDGSRGPGSWPRWTIWLLIGVLAAAFLIPNLWPSDDGEALTYNE